VRDTALSPSRVLYEGKKKTITKEKKRQSRYPIYFVEAGKKVGKGEQTYTSFWLPAAGKGGWKFLCRHGRKGGERGKRRSRSAVSSWARSEEDQGRAKEAANGKKGKRKEGVRVTER